MTNLYTYYGTTRPTQAKKRKRVFVMFESWKGKILIEGAVLNVLLIEFCRNNVQKDSSYVDDDDGPLKVLSLIPYWSQSTTNCNFESCFVKIHCLCVCSHISINIAPIWVIDEDLES